MYIYINNGTLTLTNNPGNASSCFSAVEEEERGGKRRGYGGGEQPKFGEKEEEEEDQDRGKCVDVNGDGFIVCDTTAVHSKSAVF